MDDARSPDGPLDEADANKTCNKDRPGREVSAARAFVAYVSQTS